MGSSVVAEMRFWTLQERSGAAFANWSAADDGAGSRRLDASPARLPKPRHDSPDASPPRRRPRHNSPGVSPPKPFKPRHDSPDASPPRRRERHDSPDASPPRRRSRHDSPDASPPRRKAQHDSPDASPPRRKAQHDSPDASPPRRPQGGNDGPSNRSRAGQSGKMADGTRAANLHTLQRLQDTALGQSHGMISAKDLAHEISLKRKADKDRFEKLEEKTGSRYARTVYRDKETGRMLTQEDFEEKERQAADKKRPKYETPEWGGGLRQKQEREEQRVEMERQAAKPFARSLEDVDEDLDLKDRARFGDPMAHLVKRRAEAPLPLAVPAHMAKLLKKGGFAIPQEVPSHSWLRRNMGPPPNRYGIKPGRHWDGVDRSTGFERDMFKTIAARAAQDREARAWAQADM